MNYQKVYMNQIHSSSLLCQLAQMWRSQLLCDALICTGSVVTKAHRVVLLAACPMLQSMENASIGTELEVRLAADIKQEAVNTFLQYLYEGFMLLTEDNVKHVEKVARLLQVDSVIKCCSDFFKCLEKSTGKVHNANYKFDKYDLLEFRHVRATGLQKTYHERLMKRMSESPRPTSPGKRQRLHRSSTPTLDFTSQTADDTASMTESYMTGIPTVVSGSVRSGASSQSSRSDSPSVVEIIEDSLELIQRDKSVPGKPERSRLAQQKTSISVASHVSNQKDTRVVSIADDLSGGRNRVTDPSSDSTQNIPSSPQQSAQTQMPVSPKISFRDSHPQNIQHPSPTSFISRIPPNQMSFTSQPPPPPLQQAGTLNIAPLPQTFSKDKFQSRSPNQHSSQSRPPQSIDFTSNNMSYKPPSTQHSLSATINARPSYAAGSATQAGMPLSDSSFVSPSTSQQQDLDLDVGNKEEKQTTESVKPHEDHDKGSPNGENEIPDLSIVKIENLSEDETGGLLLHVDSGQGDGTNQMHRMGQFSIEEEQEYDESDLPGDWSQEDVSNEGSLPQEGEQSGIGSMYMGRTSGLPCAEALKEQQIQSLSRNTKVNETFDSGNCQRITPDYPEEKSSDQCKSLNCKICGITCIDVMDLEIHLREYHKTYICLTCNKTYNSINNYNTHKIEIHNMNIDSCTTRSACKICGKYFGRKSRLILHEQKHSNMKLFVCPICQKSYKYKETLKVHITNKHQKRKK